jgi:hypothetical protein
MPRGPRSVRPNHCTSGWCHHSAVINADWLPDEGPVRFLCSRMVCTACGLVGADVRHGHRDRVIAATPSFAAFSANHQSCDTQRQLLHLVIH